MSMQEQTTGLIRAYVVGKRLGYSVETIRKWALRRLIPGAVFVGRHIRFDSNVVETFIRAGGTHPIPEIERERERTSEVRFHIARHGARPHSGKSSSRAHRANPLTSEAELTVQKERPEGKLNPGQGPIGYELRFLAAGRNVPKNFPWKPNSSAASHDADELD
jgi:hypothetical protein